MSRCATSPSATWRRPNDCANRNGCRKVCASRHVVADVSDEAQVQRFRDAVAEQQETDKIHLLFNNAGIGGGGSMIANDRGEWERTFNICWGGVYFNTRAFLPMLHAGRRGPYRQHQQRQRVLGIGRTSHAAHRVFGGEVRGERIFRGADRRSANERASYQGVSRDARPYRHVDRRELAQDSGRQRIGRDQRDGNRAGAGADRLDGQRSG